MPVVYEENPTVEIYDLIRDLGSQYAEIPLDYLAQYFLRAAFEACVNADLDRRKARVETIPCVSTYRLQPSDDTIINALLDIRCIGGADKGRVVKRFPQAPEAWYGGVGTWYDPNGTLHIESGSARPSTYEADFSVFPRMDACRVSREFADRYYEILRYGVQALVHETPGALFSAPLAAEFKREFQNRYRAAKLERMTGSQRGVGRVRNRRIL